jgi:hypothetical protein
VVTTAGVRRPSASGDHPESPTELQAGATMNIEAAAGLRAVIQKKEAPGGASFSRAV